MLELGQGVVCTCRFKELLGRCLHKKVPLFLETVPTCSVVLLPEMQAGFCESVLEMPVCPLLAGTGLGPPSCEPSMRNRRCRGLPTRGMLLCCWGFLAETRMVPLCHPPGTAVFQAQTRGTEAPSRLRAGYILMAFSPGF